MLHPDAQLLRRASKSPEELLSHVADAEGFLAAAVIIQAFSDTGWLTGSDTPQHGTSVDRDQARMFLLSTRGDWAAAREAWAVAANLCPDFVRDLALKLQKNPKSVAKQVNSRHVHNQRAPRAGTPQRVRVRVEYLKSRGIDITTHRPSEVARALTDGGFTTPRGFKYDGTNVIELRKQYQNCIRLRMLEP
jgi:hypothetical protein